MPGPSSSTQGKDSRPSIRSVEDLMDAPTAPDPEGLLREQGEEHRELARRLMAPLPELLREEGA